MDRLSNIFARGVVTFSNALSKMQRLSVSLLADETKSDIEYFEQYGFTSIPKSGSETLTVFIDGDRSHGIVISVSDRRYRLTSLLAGEVAIYDDLGASIILKKTGIEIHGAGSNITISGAPVVTVTGGDVIADGVSLKTHKHGGVSAGSAQTGVPV